MPDLIEALQGLVPALPEEAGAREELRQRSGGSVRQAILLLEHGGLEIAGALEAVAASPQFDVVEAHRLADAVAGRGRDAALDIMKAHAFDMLSEAARVAARGGDLDRADRLSSAWGAARRMDEDAMAFNLDRKQHALEMIGRLHAALRG